MKILTVVGARPQFIKAAALSRALRAQSDMHEVLVHTGQHYDANMSQVFFDELEIAKPAYSLEIGSGSHGAQTGRMLEAIEQVLLTERPDWTLVFGDTNSTLAGALAAAKLHVPVAHVEAGLRSHNRRMPEELNRILTDHASDLLLTPTKLAGANLQHEGIAEQRVIQVGDVMYDASLYYTRGDTAGVLRAHDLEAGKYVLATVHRAENTDDRERLVAILSALNQLAVELPVLLPLHPRTRAVLGQLDAACHDRLRIIAPVGYLEMLALEKHARLVATDSGGVQKEAYFFGVPCVTLRAETEWQELVDSGWNRLAPPGSCDAMLSTLRAALQAQKGSAEQLYGAGDAAGRIVEALRTWTAPGIER